MTSFRRRTMWSVTIILLLVSVPIANHLRGTVGTPLIMVGFAVIFIGSGIVMALLARRAAVRRARDIDTYILAGDFQRALPKLRVMVDECEDLTKPNARLTMYWRHRLAQAQYELGYITDALYTAKINLAYRTETLGRSHPDTIASQHLFDKLLGENPGH